MNFLSEGAWLFIPSASRSCYSKFKKISAAFKSIGSFWLDLALWSTRLYSFLFMTLSSKLFNSSRYELRNYSWIYYFLSTSMSILFLVFWKRSSYSIYNSRVSILSILCLSAGTNFCKILFTLWNYFTASSSSPLLIVLKSCVIVWNTLTCV